MLPMRRGAPLILAAVLALGGPPIARAVDPGDILYTDEWYGLLFAESATGALHRFGSSAPVADGLGGVVSDANGNIYAILAYAGVVHRVNAASGVYTPVSSGGFLQYPRSIAKLPGGDLLVAESTDSHGLIRIATSGGAQTQVFAGQVYSVTASAGGVVTIMVRTLGSVSGPNCRLFHVDPTTGDTVRISNTFFDCICQIATDADDNIVLTQPSRRAVKRVYPQASGAVQDLSTNGLLIQPEGIAVEGNGTIVVSDTNWSISCNPPGGPATCHGYLIRIDPVSGAQSVLSDDSYFRVGGIGIYLGPHVDTGAARTSWGRLKAIYR